MGLYTLQQAQLEIASLRGIVAHLTATLATPNVFRADCTSGLNTWTTETDVPGASVSVNTTGASSVVVAQGNFDCAANTASSSNNILGFLNWNGSNQSEEAIFIPGSLTGVRYTIGQTWVITGVTPGTYTAKLRASAGTTNMTLRTTHTNLTVMVFNTPVT